MNARWRLYERKLDGDYADTSGGFTDARLQLYRPKMATIQTQYDDYTDIRCRLYRHKMATIRT